MSSPILALCLMYLHYGITVNTILANLIGGLIFFWFDRYIFKTPLFNPLWEIKEEIKCSDCGKVAKGFRLVRTKNYDRTEDKFPQYRCEACSKIKLNQLKERGIKL